MTIKRQTNQVFQPGYGLPVYRTARPANLLSFSRNLGKQQLSDSVNPETLSINPILQLLFRKLQMQTPILRLLARRLP
jgi:hypothetical protein